MWRKALAVAIVALAGVALYQIVWIPMHCNRVKGEVHRATSLIEERVERFEVRPLALENSEKLSQCLRRRPRDIDLLVLAGANLHFSGRHDAARELYCGSLRYDRRPELYMGCGEMQALAGERESALENFVRAGEFSGLQMLSGISDGQLRREAHKIVGMRLEQTLVARGEMDTRNLVRNGTFNSGGEIGDSLTSRYNVAESPAEFWALVNRGSNPVTASIQRSPRRLGRALHISASKPGSGIMQALPRENRRARVIASAWVLVSRGTVCLGSGNGSIPLTNVCSQSTGRWEKLEAMNETCPAMMVTIVAGDEGGADFIVDEVHASVTYAAPCGPS
jgi:hypothetical protein